MGLSRNKRITYLLTYLQTKVIKLLTSARSRSNKRDTKSFHTTISSNTTALATASQLHHEDTIYKQNSREEDKTKISDVQTPNLLLQDRLLDIGLNLVVSLVVVVTVVVRTWSNGAPGIGQKL